ncbi:MAG: hypothetical protein ACFFB3_24565 [Candidatus Hodarchaeota archaeon]
MISERRQIDIKILSETLGDVGDVAAVEPLSPSDNRNYRVRFHGRTQDIFAKVIDNSGDPEHPLTSHQMGLDREFTGLNAFGSVPELLEVVHIPKPLSFQKVEAPREAKFDDMEEIQMLFLPYLKELTLESISTVIPETIYSTTEDADLKALNLAKTSAFAHYEFIFEPHQHALWQSSTSEIRTGLDDQKNHLRKAISKQNALTNLLDFPYLWHDLSNEFDDLNSKIFKNFGQESSLSRYWLTLRPLAEKGTLYFENLSENFTKANRRVIVPGERAPWNEAIFFNDSFEGRPISWQFDFEKWSEVPVSRYIGQNLAAMMHFEIPKLTNTYVLAFMIAWGTEGLRPSPGGLIEERMRDFTEIMIAAAHHAAIFRIWEAAFLLKIFKNAEGANKALEQAKQLLRNPSFFIDGCNQAMVDPDCIRAFWELRAQAGLKVSRECSQKLSGYLKEHVEHAAKLFRR